MHTPKQSRTPRFIRAHPRNTPKNTNPCFFLLVAGGGCSSGDCLGRRSSFVQRAQSSPARPVFVLVHFSSAVPHASMTQLSSRVRKETLCDPFEKSWGLWDSFNACGGSAKLILGFSRAANDPASRSMTFARPAAPLTPRGRAKKERKARPASDQYVPMWW
jgi:hypothetical protein